MPKTGKNSGGIVVLDWRPDYATRFKKGENHLQDPRRGVGKKGRSGRKKNAFKRMCRHVISSDLLRQRCLGILEDGGDKDVLNMMNTLAKYVEQMPTQKVDATFTSLEDLVAGSRKKDLDDRS